MPLSAIAAFSSFGDESINDPSLPTVPLVLEELVAVLETRETVEPDAAQAVTQLLSRVIDTGLSKNTSALVEEAIAGLANAAPAQSEAINLTSSNLNITIAPLGLLDQASEPITCPSGGEVASVQLPQHATLLAGAQGYNASHPVAAVLSTMVDVGLYPPMAIGEHVRGSSTVALTLFQNRVGLPVRKLTQRLNLSIPFEPTSVSYLAATMMSLPASLTADPAELLHVSCQWYDRLHRNWSTQGCATIVGTTKVTCSCDHLTEFAVLEVAPDPSKYSFYLERERVRLYRLEQSILCVDGPQNTFGWLACFLLPVASATFLFHALRRDRTQARKMRAQESGVLPVYDDHLSPDATIWSVLSTEIRKRMRTQRALRDVERVEELVQAANQIFVNFDADRSGAISFYELQLALKQLKFNSDPKFVANILTKYDEDGNQQLDKGEFLNLVRSVFEWQKSNRVDKRLLPRLPLYAGVCMRGLYGYTRCQTVQIAVNVIALEMLLASWLVVPQSSVNDTISPAAVVFRGTTAAIAVVPSIVVFAFAFHLWLVVRSIAVCCFCTKISRMFKRCAVRIRAARVHAYPPVAGQGSVMGAAKTSWRSPLGRRRSSIRYAPEVPAIPPEPWNAKDQWAAAVTAAVAMRSIRRTTDADPEDASTGLTPRFMVEKPVEMQGRRPRLKADKGIVMVASSEKPSPASLELRSAPST